MRLAIVAAMCGVGLALPAAITISLANEPNAAHAIADKFAANGDAERKKEAEAKARLEAEKKAAEAKAKADAKKREAARKAAEAKRRSVDAERRAAQLKADEADMLARARAEADERKAELEKAQAELARAEQEREDLEQQARLDEKNRLERVAREAKEKEAVEAARVAAEAEAERARKLAEAERLAKEAQQAQAAKAAEEARLAAARKADEDRQAEIERIARETKAAAEAQRVAAAEKAEAEAKRVAAAEKAEAEAKAEAQRREEAERDAQSKRVADRWRERAEKLGTTPVAPAGPVALTEAAPPPAIASKPSDKPTATTVKAAETTGTRATILIVMQAGDKGIRRWEKTADPMLCLGDDCYISAGAGQASERLTRAVAFGPGVALGKRAGACRHSLGCVFRDIDLGGAQATLQPIDLRVLRHDRRETSDIRLDRTCALTSGRLTCGEPVRSATYVAWIVPEAVAAKAGADMLEAIVGAGLPSASAQLDRDPMER